MNRNRSFRASNPSLCSPASNPSLTACGMNNSNGWSVTAHSGVFAGSKDKPPNANLSTQSGCAKSDSFCRNRTMPEIMDPKPFTMYTKKPNPRTEYRQQKKQRVQDSPSLEARFPELKTLSVKLAHFDATG